MVELAGAVDDPMDFNRLSTDDVKDEVGIENEDSVTIFLKAWMTRNSPDIWRSRKSANLFVDSLHK